MLILLIVPFLSTPVAEKLSAGTSSVTSYWSGEGELRNASDGALRSYGRKDNFRGESILSPLREGTVERGRGAREKGRREGRRLRV